MRKAPTALVALVVVAACGGDSSPADPAPTTTPPATVTSTTTPPSTVPPTTVAPTTTSSAPPTTSPPATTTTIPAEPTLPAAFTGADGVESTVTDTSRIIALNGDIAEIIWELGLGGSLVATDFTGEYPPEVAALPKVGIFQFLNAESIIEFNPTVVIGDEQAKPASVFEQLRGAGIPVAILEFQTTLDGLGTKARQIGQVLGVPAEGEALATRIEAEVAAALELAAAASESPTAAFIYAASPQIILLFGDGTVTNALIEGAGAVDGGKAAGISGSPQITPEALVTAAPDVLVVTDRTLEALGGEEGLLDFPGVAETPAGQSGNILSYDDSYFLGFGPRAGQALRDLILDLHPELG